MSLIEDEWPPVQEQAQVQPKSEPNQDGLDYKDSMGDTHISKANTNYKAVMDDSEVSDRAISSRDRLAYLPKHKDDMQNTEQEFDGSVTACEQGQYRQGDGRRALRGGGHPTHPTHPSRVIRHIRPL